VFEGGDTWPNSVFPLAVTGSGRPGRDDYYGIDKSWYVGARWRRPVFTAGDSPIDGPDPNSPGTSQAGENDIYLDLRGHDYITIDGITFTGFAARGTQARYSYGNCAMIEASSDGTNTDHHIVIDDIRVRDFSIDEAAGYSGGPCSVVQGYTNHPPYSGASVLENSVIAGNGTTYGNAVWGLGNVVNNEIYGLGELLILAGHGTVAGNKLYDCGYPSFPSEGGVATNTHNNALETVQADGAFYIHDNVIYNTGYNGALHDECESMFIGNAGERDYVWNNVLYDIHGNSLDLDEGGDPDGAFFWNNSLQGGLGESEPCIQEGHGGTEPQIAILNNLCFTDAGRVESGLVSPSMTSRGNALLNARRARAAGYSTAGDYAFAPPASRRRSGDAGVNLTDLCRGTLRSLCRDTTYGDSRIPLPRPAKGPWSVGAYQTPAR
jgi:hypothetical protein